MCEAPRATAHFRSKRISRTWQLRGFSTPRPIGAAKGGTTREKDPDPLTFKETRRGKCSTFFVDSTSLVVGGAEQGFANLYLSQPFLKCGTISLRL